MFYDFIYLAKGFRMRPKVRSTLSNQLLHVSTGNLTTQESVIDYMYFIWFTVLINSRGH